MILSQVSGSKKLAIIRIFSSFGDPVQATKTYIKLCEMEQDKDYLVTYKFTNNDDYTHAIILNTAMPHLTIPKSNVIGLAFEPVEYLGLTSQFIKYAETFIGKYYIGRKGNLPDPFVEHFSFMWHTPRKPIKNKNNNKIMSIIFSHKLQAPGHIYRLEIIKKILKSNLPIDIYGYGCEPLKAKLKIRDSRIKGPFNDTSPLDEYKYHICIENYQHPCYVSEKFMDPVLCGCIPIYLGATNIHQLFPNTAITLSGNLDTDFELLTKLCSVDPQEIGTYPENLKLNNHIKEIWLGN